MWENLSHHAYIWDSKVFISSRNDFSAEIKTEFMLYYSRKNQAKIQRMFHWNKNRIHALEWEKSHTKVERMFDRN